MATIAALVGDMFEDVEFAEPVKAFREAGHTVVTVGLRAGATVHGERGKETAHIDRAVADVGAGDFDALFIPGGFSPDRLRIDEDAVRFVGDFVRSNKPVFAICHAPQLLITARVLAGRQVAGWRSIIQDITNAGATYVDRDVVIDGNLISSRGPKDIPAFIRASLARLSELAAAVSPA
jgi:protease I